MGSNGPVREISVLRVLALGDLLTAVPALRALRRAYPEARISLVAPAWQTALLPMIDAVDRVVPCPELTGVGPQSPVPDLVVNLHGSGPQSVTAALRTGARRVVTHRHPDHPGLAGPEWDPELHETERWCRLLRWAGVPADRADLRLRAPGVDPLVRDAVLIHPGASAPSRQWPVERYAAVARALADAGERVLVTAGPAEVDLAAAVVSAAGGSIEPAGSWPVGSVAAAPQLSLPELAALVAAARLVVCGDTGVAHLASGYATPSVVLFGPVPPSRWGPPAGGPHVALWAGRYGDPHATEPDPGLLSLDVAAVLAAARPHVP